MLGKILANRRAKLFILSLAVYIGGVKPDRAFETVQAVTDCNVCNIVIQNTSPGHGKPPEM